MVGKESRMIAGVIFMMFFSLGFMLMGVLAFFVTDWRFYQIALTIPGLIFLAYWWIIPESTRWLLANNRKYKAIKQIKRIAESNNVIVPKEMLDKLVENETDSTDPDNNNKKKATALDLFRQPHLRSKALLIFFNWFVVSGEH